MNNKNIPAECELLSGAVKELHQLNELTKQLDAVHNISNDPVIEAHKFHIFQITKALKSLCDVKPRSLSK